MDTSIVDSIPTSLSLMDIRGRQRQAEYINKLRRMQEDLLMQEHNNFTNAVDRLCARGSETRLSTGAPKSFRSQATPRKEFITTYEQFQKVKRPRSPPKLTPLQGRQLVEPRTQGSVRCFSSPASPVDMTSRFFIGVPELKSLQPSSLSTHMGKLHVPVLPKKPGTSHTWEQHTSMIPHGNKNKWHLSLDLDAITSPNNNTPRTDRYVPESSTFHGTARWRKPETCRSEKGRYGHKKGAALLIAPKHSQRFSGTPLTLDGKRFKQVSKTVHGGERESDSRGWGDANHVLNVVVREPEVGPNSPTDDMFLEQEIQRVWGDDSYGAFKSDTNNSNKRMIVVEMPAVALSSASSSSCGLSPRESVSLAKMFKQNELREKEVRNLLEDIKELNKLNESIQSMYPEHDSVIHDKIEMDEV